MLAENSDKTAKRKRGPGRPFPKGVSGNPGGRPKKLPVTEILQQILEDPENARAYALAAIKHAQKGSSAHFKEINDRVEGKPTETIDLAISYTEALSKMRAKRERD